MNNFDCVVCGKKLKSGSSTNKDTGVVKPWTDVYTPNGAVVRVYKFDGSSVPDMSEVNLHCSCRVYDGNIFVSFLKMLK